MAHWILIRDVNDYDQHGSYYDASWSEKPSVSQIIKANKTITIEQAEKLLSEGVASQDPYPGVWEMWELIEVKGENYYGS